MKFALLSFFILSFYCSMAQLPQMKPELGRLVDLSPEAEKAFDDHVNRCNMIWGVDQTRELTPEEKEYVKTCDETEVYGSPISEGCSWYCGGGMDTNSASSSLKPSGSMTYKAGNIHDLDYKTAWVEGVKGFGIGEYVTYHFPAENPRITEVIVVNGYIKSEKAWKENSRVKKMKMYVDDQAIAILNLEDSRREQHFKFEPIGHQNREDHKAIQNMPWWTMKFEIVEVYPGSKYEDTAISEIYFDGIDVH